MNFLLEWSGYIIYKINFFISKQDTFGQIILGLLFNSLIFYPFFLLLFYFVNFFIKVDNSNLLSYAFISSLINLLFIKLNIDDTLFWLKNQSQAQSNNKFFENKEISLTG